MIHSLTVPDNFMVELVAGPPLVDRPIMASFDDHGRLYVADSAGVNLPGAELAKNPPHRIVVLEDADGDGVFDQSRLFADKIVFPQGLLWHNGAVFVASPPCLWRLDDTDGDGVCDKRTALIRGFPLTGVSDDMHGACLGPDGFVYVCVGRMPHKLVDIDGKPLESGGRQPLLVRCRPDGSGAEIVGGTHGNGVEVAWTDEGDAFVSGTFYGGGEGLRDALIHFVEGGNYPVLDLPATSNQMKSTGELLPPLVHSGATAPAGIMRYRGRAIGDKYEDNLFCAYFNLHSVQRHVVERTGATFRAGAETFLSSTNGDFHPTDVLQDDRDGSLLVVDTGAWFLIGCPTSKIAKPDIKGGIYRVCRKEPSPSVPEVATKNAAEVARRNALWAITRTEGPAARQATREALGDASASVRQVAAYAVGLHRDAVAVKRLMELLASDTPPVRREAANALGRIGQAQAAPALLAALKGGAADRFLEHAIIYALIRIGDRDATANALREGDVFGKRGALIALDQMEGGRLTPDMVMPMLNPAEPTLHKAAMRVLSRHPEWAAAMLGYFRDALSAAGELPVARREELRQQFIAFAVDPGVQALVAETLRARSTDLERQLLMLEVIALAPAGRLPEAWAVALRECLTDHDERIVRQAVLTVRALPEGARPVLTRVDRHVDFVEASSNQPFAGTDLIDHFAVRWTCLLRVPRAGRYAFATISNDGSRLFIDERMVVENGSRHGMVEKSGEVELSAGDHALRLEFFQGTGGKGCRLLWSAGGIKEVVPADALFHQQQGALAPGLVGEYFVLRGPLADFPDLTAVNFDSA
ncbi:MAG: PVC-type heme-binding CxxCH protein, partial [Tepidisphaeraceae bacterium]